MNITTDNFIFIMDNFLLKEEVDQYIEYFDNCQRCGMTADRYSSEGVSNHLKSDDSVVLNELHSIKILNTPGVSRHFLEKFWSTAYPVYNDTFGILKESANHKINYLKMQKTGIGQGYHSWHFETQDIPSSNRLLAFICYLNDVHEGGETEFLYYPKRIKSKTGRLIIFPTSFTHTHRGNPPISNEKYIITGWVEYS